MRHVIEIPDEIEQALEKRASETGDNVAHIIERPWPYLSATALKCRRPVADQIHPWTQPKALRLATYRGLPRGPLRSGCSRVECLIQLLSRHKLVDEQIRLGHRRSAISTPYREHLAQHFATIR